MDNVVEGNVARTHLLLWKGFSCNFDQTKYGLLGQFLQIARFDVDRVWDDKYVRLEKSIKMILSDIFPKLWIEMTMNEFGRKEKEQKGKMK